MKKGLKKFQWYWHINLGWEHCKQVHTIKKKGRIFFFPKKKINENWTFNFLRMEEEILKY